MVNRIPNGSLLTNKLGLLNSLQDYARVRIVAFNFFSVICSFIFRHILFWLHAVDYKLTIWLPVSFYPRDAMHSTVFATATCPSVCLSVRHSRYCV